MGKHIGCVRLLLSRSDVNVNAKDAGGSTALEWAARGGERRCVELLLSRSDININMEGSKGRTSLTWAVIEGQLYSIELLLSRADVVVNPRDINGHSPLYFAVRKTTTDFDCYRLCLELLLSRDGVTANIYDTNGLTPLYWAARINLYHHRRGGDFIVGQDYENYLASLELLLSKSDKVVHTRDHRGRTVLATAAKDWNEPCVRVLLAQSDCLINDQD